MIHITEVSPRDGLQNEKRIVPTDVKIRFVDALSACGVDGIEVTSFVSPRWIPQLADADEVLARVSRRRGVVYSALVPNERGLERALSCRPDEIAVFVATSETFSQKNINTSIEGAFERFVPVIPRALAAGMTVRGYMSTVFWCPYEGRMPIAKAVDLAERLVAAGCHRVALGDTVGKAVPEHVAELLDAMLQRLPRERLAMHFHDTYGLAADNVRVALERGIEHFDASVGGLGGCPYAGAGAAGNVATETVVRVIREQGHEVAVDLDALAAARRIVQEALASPPGPLPSSSVER